MSEADFKITYETISPNDPLVNGARWRKERDEARSALAAAEARAETMKRMLREQAIGARFLEDSDRENEERADAAEDRAASLEQALREIAEHLEHKSRTASTHLRSGYRAAGEWVRQRAEGRLDHEGRIARPLRENPPDDSPLVVAAREAIEAAIGLRASVYRARSSANGGAFIDAIDRPNYRRRVEAVQLWLGDELTGDFSDEQVAQWRAALPERAPGDTDA